jgi:hypothetical protein
MATRKKTGSPRTGGGGPSRSSTRAGAGPRAKAVTAKAPRDPVVVYVHGIGNKPLESVLKEQWDRALFGSPMGDRTRMAYWVDRSRYPVPEPAEPTQGDRFEPPSGSVGTRAEGRDAIDATIGSLAKNAAQRAALERIAGAMLARSAAERPAGEDALADAREAGVRARAVREKVLPLPAPLRDAIARLTTRLFLHDVHDFLYDAGARTRMEKALRDRLTGPGPFVVIAHSQGTLLAYDVLAGIPADDMRVPLLVTIGSPLGIQEVQDEMLKWRGLKKKPLPWPQCVARWVNVADRLDPVAIDQELRGEIGPPDAPLEEHHGFGVNPDEARDPHSATGYLSTPWVRDAVRATLPGDFDGLVRHFVVARDLTTDLADDPAARHPVLLQLEELEPGHTLAAARDSLLAHLRGVLGKEFEAARVESMKRYVSARLTRREVEELQSQHADLRIEHLWRNARKRALVYRSAQTLQVAPAHDSYRAGGRGIHWAVLDTGVAAAHPHFARGHTIEAAWNCTVHGAPAAGAADGDGHGTHVCGIIAGDWGADLPLTAHHGAERVRMRGMAPEAKLHVYKVLDDQGNGEDAWIIKALDHIADTNDAAGRLVIHGVNLSLGGSFDPDVYGCGHTPLCEELRRLWRQGVLVVLAAGNEGFAELRAKGGSIPANMPLSIGDPANLEEAIAVGSVHRDAPHTFGISYFSSRGPTADGRRKPDVVAPGERIMSARFDGAPPARKSALVTVADWYVPMDGTSMACPHISGLLAAFLSVRREFVGDPDRVKRLLLEHCTDLERDPYAQGRGLANLVRMLVGT